MNIEIVNFPRKKDVDILKNGLKAYNESLQQHRNGKPLAVFLRDEQNHIQGGFYGSTYWGWLYIQHLWVSQSLRGGGHGRQLFMAAEKEALKRGCNHAYVDTLSFQNAIRFYSGLGYEKFAELENLPGNHSLLFMKKSNIHLYY